MKKRIFIHLIFLLIMATSCKKYPGKYFNDEMYKKPPNCYFEFISPEYQAHVGEKVRVKADATDEDGIVESVWFYANGNLFAIDTIEPWEQELNFPDVEELIVSGYAIDNDGLFSAERLDMLERLPETVYGTLTVSSDSININESFQLKATSYSYYDEVVRNDLYINDSLYATSTESTSIFSLDSLPAGMHSAQVRITDSKGIVGQSYPLNFRIHGNIAPSIELFLSPSDRYLPGHYIFFTLNGQDLDGFVKSVQLFRDDEYVAGYNSQSADLADITDTGGTFRYHAVATDNLGKQSRSETITVEVNPGFRLSNYLVDLEPTINPDKVYGLIYASQNLIEFDPVNQAKTDIPLPKPAPIELAYDQTTDKVYILYLYADAVSVYNPATSGFTNFSFPANSDAIDIELDPINGRIYILTVNHLFIMNMENGEIIQILENHQFSDILMDTEHKCLFGLKSSSNIYIKKYDVSNDTFLLIHQANHSGSRYGEALINKSNNYMILPGAYFNGKLLALDLTNPNIIAGEFEVSHFAHQIALSRDEQSLFAITYEPNKIWQLSTTSFQQIQSITVEQSFYTTFCVNASVSHLVVGNRTNIGTNTNYIAFINLLQ